MSVSLRLSRGGSKKRPYYKVVVANSRAPRDGKYLEQVGTYNPLLAKDDENRVRLVEDRVRYWLGVGAQPTDRVARMLDKAGIKERAATVNPKKGEPGQKAKDRAEEKAEKAAEAAEAAAAAAAAPVVEEVVEAAVEEAAPEAPAAEEAAVEEAAAEAPAAEEAAAEAPAAEEAAAEEAAAEEAPAAEASEEQAEG
ncbi:MULTISPECIES: 30S ribosomal protein S16 [unclassified Novosphingobium]|uniref:30S ribosomal protein S16 n=1 Tax=unclassified Novosphingobium TaxID=2644732 RepID=UPI0025EB4FF2|nr:MULTISPECIES: 30S ribosomal protein S16 [unclassified Novosphingobium]HQV03083.1 30S ribosomal protein S16 [Novosphingobium sp.]